MGYGLVFLAILVAMMIAAGVVKLFWDDISGADSEKHEGWRTGRRAGTLRRERLHRRGEGPRRTPSTDEGYDKGQVKGQQGEELVKRHLSELDPAVYSTFHEVFLPRANVGGTTEVDHIVVSRYGVSVIETKSIDGTITGSPDDEHWTRSFPGREEQIRNPLRQNHVHVLAVTEFLDVNRSVVESLVFMAGNVEATTDLGPDVLLGEGLTRRIERRRRARLDPDAVKRCVEALRAHQAATDPNQAREEHLAQIRREHGAN